MPRAKSSIAENSALPSHGAALNRAVWAISRVARKIRAAEGSRECDEIRSSTFAATSAGSPSRPSGSDRSVVPEASRAREPMA